VVILLALDEVVRQSTGTSCQCIVRLRVDMALADKSVTCVCSEDEIHPELRFVGAGIL
jgi:hypothetical protein